MKIEWMFDEMSAAAIRCTSAADKRLIVVPKTRRLRPGRPQCRAPAPLPPNAPPRGETRR